MGPSIWIQICGFAAIVALVVMFLAFFPADYRAVLALIEVQS